MNRCALITLLLLVGCDGRPGSDAGVPPGVDGHVPTDAGFVPPSCEGLALESDGVLDLDLSPADGPAELVRVEGRVAVDGAAPPSGPQGSLVFEADALGFTAPIELGGYEVELPAGRYAVRYAPPDARCDAASALPCVGGVVHRELEVRASGVVDLDVATAAVQGRVTVDGAPLDRDDVGSLVLARDDGAAVAAVDGGGWSARVVAGTYSLAWATDGRHCDGRVVPTAPCNSGEIRPEVGLTADGLLDVDLATVALQGRLTADGAGLGEDPGVLTFAVSGPVADDEAPAGWSTRVDATGAYATRLLRGRYDAAWSPSVPCDGARARPTPCLGATLREGVDLSADGVLDLALSSVELTGRLTVDGAPLPSGSDYGGALRFVDGERSLDVPLSAARSSYTVTLPRGTYRLAWAPAGFACDGRRPADGPCLGSDLRDGFRAEADGVLDVDVPVVQLSGRVTVDGEALSGAAFGSLVFAAPDAEAEAGLVVPMPPDGQYAVSLPPGAVRVSYAGEASRCAEATQLPCVGGALLERDVSSDGVLDVDIDAVRVSGNVTVASMAPAEGARGALMLIRDDDAAVSLPVASSGPAAFAATVIAGDYELAWAPAPGCDADGRHGPCMAGPLGRTLPLRSDGALDVDVPLVRLRGRVTLAGAPLPAETRGDLVFERLDGSRATVSLTEAVGGDYGAALLPGRYVVAYAPGGACEPGGPPCALTVLAGCEE